MKDGLKAAAVFIGTVIGAGFATGQEVQLYFRNSSPVVAVFAGLLLGALCSLFMWLGSRAGDTADGVFLFGRHRSLYDVIVFICAFITFIAMFNGAEVLILSTFGIAHTGVISVILAAIFSAKGLKGLKFLNVFAVPLIIIFIIVIYAKNGEVAKAGSFNPLNGIAYAGLNIMLAGSVMFRIGKGASPRSARVAGISSGVALAVMLYMLTVLVDNRLGEMPVYIAARSLGLDKLAGAVIFLAVFTTMVSALEQSADLLGRLLPHKSLAVPTVCLMAYPITILLSFSQTVDYLYPVVSVAGVILLGTAVYRALQLRQNKTSK